MNQEQVNQIVETVKTLNLNVDSQSAVQIIEMIKPLIYWHLFRGILSDIFFTAIPLTFFILIYKIIRYYLKKEYE